MSSDLSNFRQWFEEFDAQVWDRQFEADVKSGKLNKIAEQALNDYRTGKAKARHSQNLRPENWH